MPMVANIAIGMKQISRMSPMTKPIGAKIIAPNQPHSFFIPQAEMTAQKIGMYNTSAKGHRMMQSSTSPMIFKILLHKPDSTLSPAFALSSIIPTPQPRMNPKWLSAEVELAPHAQQNS